MYKRLWIFTIIAALVIGVTKDAAADPAFNIAIFQHQEFEPFQKAHDGFLKTLFASDYKDRIIIVEDFNAKSDIGSLEAKIETVSHRSDIDLIFAIGTHSTERLVKGVKNIPIVFTIVGDAEKAGIVTNWKSSGSNYTGIETPNYYSQVVRLMHHYVPFKRLGMLYLEGSPSHEAGIHQIVILSKELGFEFVRRGFPLRNQQKVPFPKPVIRKNIKNALAAVCPQVDAFFVQTSNTFTQHFDLFREAFEKHQLISAGDPTNIQKGLVMGIGKNAWRFGEQAALYSIKILEGTAPSALPMDVGTKLTIDLNLKAAERIGYQPPFELLSGADNLYQSIDLAQTD